MGANSLRWYHRLALVGSVGLCFVASAANAQTAVPDSQFGSQGFTLVQPPAGYDNFETIALLPAPSNAYTAVAGAHIVNAFGPSFGVALVRVSATGALDASFQSGGIRVRDTFGAKNKALFSVVAACTDPQGKIVVAGQAPGTDGQSTDTFLARFNTDGSDDASFGTDGFLTLNLANTAQIHSDVPTDVLCRSDGAIVVTGNFTYPNEFGSPNSGPALALVSDNTILYSNLPLEFGNKRAATLSADAGNTVWQVVVQSGAVNLRQFDQQLMVVTGSSINLPPCAGTNPALMIAPFKATPVDPANGEIQLVGAANDPISGVHEVSAARIDTIHRTAACSILGEFPSVNGPSAIATAIARSPTRLYVAATFGFGGSFYYTELGKTYVGAYDLTAMFPTFVPAMEFTASTAYNIEYPPPPSSVTNPSDVATALLWDNRQGHEDLVVGGSHADTYDPHVSSMDYTSVARLANTDLLFRDGFDFDNF